MNGSLAFWTNRRAGVKSAAPFYEKVLVEPQPAHLKRIRSTTPTPKGDVKLDLSFGAGKTTGTVVLPSGLCDTFRWNGVDLTLSPGVNHIQSSAEPGAKTSAESFRTDGGRTPRNARFTGLSAISTL